jgi:CheY-like chemotaxis protein
MAPSVVEKVFEPFFTTKEVGKGTGLGLAQVWGFAKQSGGHVEIESQIGRGTIVKLYIPESSEPAKADQSHVSNDEPGGAETILVVEDDDNVRNIVVETLSELGYHLVVARDGPEALAALRIEGQIDLLFTDQVMPNGITGLELAHQARVLRPGIKVLLCSGYAKRIATMNGEERFPLIAKPYRRADLARKLRSVLEESALSGQSLP